CVERRNAGEQWQLGVLASQEVGPYADRAVCLTIFLVMHACMETKFFFIFLLFSFSPVM
uniref:Uncharacterized protein n=1 Tax=Aegilops tauschii subsp. strangulata TaxID=200361 RepID=A0A453PQ56_AEGTS